MRQATAIAEALGIRVALPLLLRALPLDGVLAALTPARADRRRDPGALTRIEHATDVVTRRLPLTRTACLHRALMRYRMLRREGYPARFVIGVRPGGPEGFEAHAWVTLEDEPFLEAEPPSYRTTFVWPPTEAATRVEQP